MPLPEFGGTLGKKRAAHLLRRATFGATVEQIDYFAGLTAGQAITQLFRQALPDPSLPIEPATGVDWIANNPHPDTSQDDLTWYFKGWFVGQMMSAGISPSPVYLPAAYSAREKLVFFLHTHFTAISTKINSARALYYQNMLFRLYALDATADADINIKELTKKISVDVAMLLLLDGSQNSKGSPNENYAREFLELYSIGRGLEVANYFSDSPVEDPQNTDYVVYTENDVKAAALVFTGWTFNDEFTNLDVDTGLPRAIFNPSRHDNTVKQFSSRLGGSVVTPDPTLALGNNPTEESALDEISQLVEIMFAQEETRKNICRKIYRYFVFAPHDEAGINDVDANIIQNMAATLVANGFKIQPVIENLLRSNHFYEAAGGYGDDNFGGIIKSPLDLVLSTLQFFKHPIPNMTSSPTEFYTFTREIFEHMHDMGMEFYEPFDVAGYDAYHQFPVYHRSWISVNYLTMRYNFIRELFVPRTDSVILVNAHTFVSSTSALSSSAATARGLVLEVIRYLLPVADNLNFDGATDDDATITAERLNYFLTEFLSTIDADPEGMWVTRWSSQTGVATLREQLENLFNALLQSPEYQLA